MIATLLTSVCLSLSPAMLVEPPEEPAAIAAITLEALPVVEGGDYFSAMGWRCHEFTGCPAGAIAIDENGNHFGCVAETSPVPDCSGDCYTCDGVTGGGTTRLCVSTPMTLCKTPTSPRLSACGNARKHPNACTTVKPSGVPTTPNGCYCNTGIGYTLLVEQCIVSECQL